MNTHARAILRAPSHFGGGAGRWHCSYHDATTPLKVVYKPVIPASLAGFMVAPLGTEARVWGRALAETFDGTPVMDTELNDIHLAAQQTILDNNLEPLVRWALWSVELTHITALGIAPVANLVAPPNQWVDVYYYPSNEVLEVLLETQAQREELWMFLQLASWDDPTKTAINHRIQLAKAAYSKLAPFWRSKVPLSVKLRVFESNIVSVATYSLATLTLEDKHLKQIDSWYFNYLRRVVGIKASYYSRIPNKAVWLKANKPATPSQTLMSAQFKLLTESILTPTDDPFHHVMFSPGYTDRVNLSACTNIFCTRRPPLNQATPHKPGLTS